MSEPKVTTCIIYCRVSSKEQIEGTSLATQERVCRDYAERYGMVVLRVFVEMGESAKTADRTEFTKAIAYCGNKKQSVGYFLVYKIDRFARNQDDHVVVRSLLKKSGTELRSATETFDDSPVGRAMEGMLSVFAEFDNNNRRERTKEGMKKRFQEGIWIWPAPLGFYKPERGKGTNIVPDALTAPFIKQTFEEYVKGVYTYKSLALYMAKMGLRTRQNKVPSPQLMEKILHNPLYCGRMEAYGVVCFGKFTPIISENLFLSCQREQKFIKPRSANNPTFPLRKFVMCGECGAKLTGSQSSGKKGRRYPYYHHGAAKCPKAISIPKETFEQQFVELLDSLAPTTKYEKLFKAVVLDLWQERHKRADVENAQIQKEMEKLREDRQRIFEYHRKGVYTDDDFSTQKRLIEEKIGQKQLLIRDKITDEFEMSQALEYCFNSVRNASRIWLESSYERKIQLQRLILEKPVSFDGEKFGNPELSVILQQKKTLVTESFLYGSA